ncbi:MAG: hypothetical protein WC050_03840, partial [Candidatus Paceibacterota bacterium]
LYGFVQGVLPRLSGLLVLIVVATIAGRALRFHSAKDIFPYSLAWAVIIVLFDMVYSVPFTGWQLYTDWNVWLGYALVFAVPLLSPYTRRDRLEVHE